VSVLERGLPERETFNTEHVTKLPTSFVIWTLGVQGFRFPAGTGNFSLHHCVENGSGARPATYPMGTGALFLGVKRPGREADHSPPFSAEVKEWVKLYLHSPNTPSWPGAQLKHRDTTFYFVLNNVTSFFSMSFVDANVSTLPWCEAVQKHLTFGPRGHEVCEKFRT
jgi:hypothetical protein